MSNSTAIQWCDSTVNPTMGCDGCELWNTVQPICYAGVLHRRFGGRTRGYAPTFEEVTLFPGRMAIAAQWSDLSGKARRDKPWLDGLPRKIFVSDMSDALSSVVPFEYLHDEVVLAADSPSGRRHRWLWLTKRPGHMAEFSSWLAHRGSPWPTNLWVGTSVTTQRTTTRIVNLLRVGNRSTTRFLSVEPQWEPIDLQSSLCDLDWVIQGGQSGPCAREFDITWARQLKRQCREAKVPYFLKQLGSTVSQLGKRLRFRHSHAGDWHEWPQDLRVREMPIRERTHHEAT